MSTDLTTIRAELEQAQALSEKATPGDWTADNALVIYPGPEVAVVYNQPSAEDAELIAAYRSLTPKLNEAMQKVLDLHHPVKLWLAYPGADFSFHTKEDALDYYPEHEGDLTSFEVCAMCMKIEESPCEGECTRESGYLESLWPCATVRPILDAWGGQGA